VGEDEFVIITLKIVADVGAARPIWRSRIQPVEIDISAANEE
jgi:hypothetical protein